MMRAVLLPVCILAVGFASAASAVTPQEEWKKEIAEGNVAFATRPHAILKIQDAAYLGEGEYLKATDTFIHSISLEPTAYAYSNVGTSYFYLHRFDDAAANYEQALKLGDDDFEIWWNLGEAYYWSAGRRSEAEHAFRQCVSLGTPRLNVDPRDVEAMSVLAVCHAMLGERSEATELILNADALGPKDAELSFKEALVYTQLRDTEQAVARLRDALDAGYPAALARDTPMFDQLRSDPRVQQLFQAK